MNVLILFIILSVLNVIIQTVKSIATVKSGKTVAAIVNAVAYGLYTVVLVYTNADFPLWEKVIVTALCNLIGVYVVKLIEEKMRKDKLWKVEMTLPCKNSVQLARVLKNADVPYNYINDSTSRYSIFNIYCATQKQSHAVKEIAKTFNAKYFVVESKTL